MTRLCRKLTAAAIILTIGIGAWLWLIAHEDELNELEVHYQEIT
jgi:hypothetical protein